VANAHYWIAASHDRQGNYEEALRGYTRVIHDYPDGIKAPAARLMRGKTLLRLGRIEDGKKALRGLMKLFPQTDEAKKADKFLKKIEKEPKGKK